MQKSQDVSRSINPQTKMFPMFSAAVWQKQMMNYIVESRPMTKLADGLLQLPGRPL